MQGFKPFQRYFEFTGRSGRAEYWQYIAITTVAEWFASIADSLASGPYVATHKFAAILAIATLIPTLAVGIRRLHDRGRSGWLFGLLYILVGVAAVLIVTGKAIYDRTGNGSVEWAGILVGLVTLAYGVFIIVQLAKPGDAGSNAYGPPDTTPDTVTPRVGAFVQSLASPTQPVQSAPDTDPMIAIERLGKMRDQGYLSDEEFAQQKQRLLSQVIGSESVRP